MSKQDEFIDWFEKISKEQEQSAKRETGEAFASAIGVDRMRVIEHLEDQMRKNPFSMQYHGLMTAIMLSSAMIANAIEKRSDDHERGSP